jgi:hypothetical protein
MYPNLLERDMVDILQAGANPEILLREYLASEDHIPEKRRLSRVELEPKKSRRESASTAPASEEVCDQPPDFMELSDRYFSEGEDYVHRRGIALVRCSAIDGISYRYHCCGPVCMLEDKGKCRRSSLRMAFRIFRCHRAFKPTRSRLTPRLGTSSLLSLYVDVWRLIFLKLNLPRDGVRRCSAPCRSMLYVRSFFKNGTDLTVFVRL